MYPEDFEKTLAERQHARPSNRFSTVLVFLFVSVLVGLIFGHLIGPLLGNLIASVFGNLIVLL